MNFWDFLFWLISGERPEPRQQESLPPNEPPPQINSSDRLPYELFTYRTVDGQRYFQFSYHNIGSGYEIDIHKLPSLEGRSNNQHTTHWLRSSREADKKICIASSHTPNTLEDAKSVSKQWAELINCYIEIGVSPDEQLTNQSHN